MLAILAAHLLRGQVVALGDLLVELPDVAEVRYQARGAAVGQLAVEDQRRRLRVPGRRSHLLLLERRSAVARTAAGTVITRAAVMTVVTAGLMRMAVLVVVAAMLHAVRGLLRYRRSRRGPRLEQRHRSILLLNKLQREAPLYAQPGATVLPGLLIVKLNYRDRQLGNGQIVRSLAGASSHASISRRNRTRSRR